MVQYSKIKSALLRYHTFSDENIKLLESKLVYQELRRKSFLLKEHQVSFNLYLVLKGSFRLFHQTKNEQVTIMLYSENDWISNLESLLYKKPSESFIEANEDAQVAAISLTDIHALMDANSEFKMLNGILADLTISQSYLANLKSKSPDLKYKELQLKHPDWINRFSRKHIASYLGMTPETLSRVRGRFS